MKSPDVREFVEGFLNHPSPIIYTHRPEIPELCSAVIPEAGGAFSDKSPRMGLGSLLLEVSRMGVKDLRTLWHSWGPQGLWKYTTRQDLTDALDKPLTFFFDCPTISPKQFPEDLKNPEFMQLDVRKVPFIPWLKGPIFEVVLGLQDVVPVFSLRVPTEPTSTRLKKLDLVYARR